MPELILSWKSFYTGSRFIPEVFSYRKSLYTGFLFIPDFPCPARLCNIFDPVYPASMQPHEVVVGSLTAASCIALRELRRDFGFRSRREVPAFLGRMSASLLGNILGGGGLYFGCPSGIGFFQEPFATNSTIYRGFHAAKR